MFDLKKFVRDIPDFPKQGIVFRDISPLLSNIDVFFHVVETMAGQWVEEEVQCIGMLDARGFIFGTALAVELGCPFFMIRKAGKLPGSVYSETYSLEYGGNTLELQKGVFKQDAKVLLVDDVLATGGSAAAGARLIQKAGGQVLGLATLIELTYCNGRENFKHPVTTCLTY